MGISELVAAIESFNERLKNLPDGPSAHFENALKFNNKTISDIKVETDALFDPHIQSTGNTHNTTPGEIDSYNKTDVDEKIGKLIPNGLILIDEYRSSNYSISNQWTLIIEDTINVLFCGRMLSLLSVNLDLNAIYDNDKENKTFYIYVHLKNTDPFELEYLTSEDNTLDQTDLSYLKIGKITTDTNEITAVEINHVIRIAGKYLSSVQKPMSIPISELHPAFQTSTHWL